MAGFAILGPLRVRYEGAAVRTTGRQRAVLGMLLLNAGVPVSRDRLIAALWDRPPRSAVANLQTHVWGLRRALAPTPWDVATDGRGYRLTVGRDDLDLLAFEDLQRRGREELLRGDLDAAGRALGGAVALWRGRPLEDVPLGASVVSRLAELEERYGQVHADWVDARLGAGEHGTLIAVLRRAVAAQPLRERAWEQLILALHRSGDRAEALAAYQRARAALVEELGVEPGERLQRLHAAVLSGAAAPVRLTRAPCPLPPSPGRTAPDAADLNNRAACSFSPTADATGRAAQFHGCAADVSGRLSGCAACRSAQGVVRAGGRGACLEGREVGRAVCQLPPDVADFTGRVAEVREIRGRLARTRRTPGVVVVTGPPGVGKSALAVHVAHLVRRDFPGGQLYVRLGAASTADVLGELLRALGVDGTDIPGSVAARAALYRARLADRAVLIVLDGAADTGRLGALLPGTASAGVLITSRGGPVGLPGAYRLRLDVPGERDAMTLLGRVAGRARPTGDPDAARDVLRACGRLPLALRAAGARLAARPGWPVRDLADRLSDPPGRLDELAVGSITVRAGFADAYRALPPTARRAFRMLGLIDIGDIGDFAPWTVAALLGDARAADRAIEALVLSGLLTCVDGDRYVLHDLIGVFAAERARAEERPTGRLAAQTRFLRHCLERTSGAAHFLRPAPGEQATAWIGAERRILVAAVELAAALGQARTAIRLAFPLTADLMINGRHDDVARVQRAVRDAVARADLIVAGLSLEHGSAAAAI